MVGSVNLETPTWDVGDILFNSFRHTHNGVDVSGKNHALWAVFAGNNNVIFEVRRDSFPTKAYYEHCSFLY
jgi:hypothetical protein